MVNFIEENPQHEATLQPTRDFKENEGKVIERLIDYIRENELSENEILN